LEGRPFRLDKVQYIYGNVLNNHRAACAGVFWNRNRHWSTSFVRIFGTSNVLMSELWGLVTALELV